MTKLINVTTGDNTERFGFRGTDLGYFCKTNHGYCLSVFGDTFDNHMPGGPGWRSPVILRQHNTDLDVGLKWDNAVGGSRAKEVVSYIHHDVETAKTKPYHPHTIIPNDIVHLPDGTYIMSTFVVRSWDREGPHSWVTWGVKWYFSTEKHAEHWQEAIFSDLGNRPIQFDNVKNQHWRFFQNQTFILHEDGYLYLFGTESGRTDGGGIYLARTRWQDWRSLFKWQFYRQENGTWSWGEKEPTPIIKPTITVQPIGEINAQLIEGCVVIAYIDYGVGAVTRTAVHPTGEWTQPQLHATQLDTPNLYAPSIHPYSTFKKPFMHLSQWKHDFYGVKFYQLKPLTDPRPQKDTPPETPQLGSLDVKTIVETLTSKTDLDPKALAQEIASRLKQ